MAEVDAAENPCRKGKMDLMQSKNKDIYQESNFNALN